MTAPSSRFMRDTITAAGLPLTVNRMDSARRSGVCSLMPDAAHTTS